MSVIPHSQKPVQAGDSQTASLFLLIFRGLSSGGALLTVYERVKKFVLEFSTI